MGAEMIDARLCMPAAAWPYAQIQRGSLDHLRANRAEWMAAYEAQLVSQFEAIQPWIPIASGAPRILDIGGGIGGIDVLLSRHYQGRAGVNVCDGVADPPVVERHAKTFNSMGATAEFLEANGVEFEDILSPSHFQDRARAWGGTFDLVVSFGAWCFHIPPHEYLGAVRHVLRKGGVLIVERRLLKVDWRLHLQAAFGDPIGVCGHSEKWVREVYQCP